MKLGKLEFGPVEDNWDLVAQPVKDAIQAHKLSGVLVSEIDPELADTAAFCDKYDIELDISANCVIVEAKRTEKSWYAGCMILATDRADINGVGRRQLEAKKLSFAAMDQAVSFSQMEYGGITPIGLPADWPLIVDAAIVDKAQIIIGSGLRKSKLLIPGKLLADLPSAAVLDIVKR